MEYIHKIVGEGGGGRGEDLRKRKTTTTKKPSAPAPKPSAPAPKPSTPIPAPTDTSKPLSFEEWLKKNPPDSTGHWKTPGIGNGTSSTAKNVYNNVYLKNFKPTTTTPKPTTPKPSAPGGPAKVVPGTPVPGTGQVNVADYGGEVAKNPSLGLTLDNPKTTNVNESMHLSTRVPDINPTAPGTNVNPNDPKYKMGTLVAPTATGGEAATAELTAAKKAKTYEAKTTINDIKKDGQMKAAQGTLSEGSIIGEDEIPLLDMKGAYSGVNEDGSINYTGLALNDYASQDLDEVNEKATVQGQLALLQAQFTDPLTGEPKIPMWAAGTARNVSRIAAFKGMTGTAATAAMAQALMEASIPIAQQDAQFFQTLTLQNLSNKQASIINKANVLAKFDLTNVDNRMAAAIENSKAFLQMDMANLDNRQQAEVLNTQARIQSILEDAKATNAARMFGAEQENDMAKFYDELNANIKQFNASQVNNMKQFNASEKNSMSKFNAELENNRQQFYKTMQYNIDISNAKWRQTVTLAEAEMAFEAAATDVKNMVGISNEQLNRLWDRSDSLLDYLWKSTESELDRKNALALAKLQGKMNLEAKDKEGFGSILGSIAGAGAGKFFDFLF